MIQINSLYVMTDQKKQIFQIYFAGASLAFGFPLLVGEVISLVFGGFSNEFSQLFSILYILLHVLGGLVGGTLVARKVDKQETVRAGAVTGLLAFLLHQVVYSFFYGTGVIGDPFTLFALIGGSIAGAMYTKQKMPHNIQVDK